jgi:hypothetical protein
VGYAVDQFNQDLLTPDIIKQVEEARAKIIECERMRSTVAPEEKKKVKCEIDVTDAMAK